MDFIDVVKIKYDKLTTTEKKIADYIFSNSDTFLQLNSQGIGATTKTSAASVMRFCKKLGFEGLEQLKVEIAKSELHTKDENEIDPILQVGDSDENVVLKVYSHIDIALKKTVNLIDFPVLHKILDIIRKANHIYLYGIGASSLSAYDLYHKFNRVDKPTFYNMDGHMNIEFSVHSKPNDVAIALSYAGDSKEVLLAVEQLKKNKTPVVAIVKEGDTILQGIADYCLYVPDIEKRIKMGALSSKFSQMFLVDIIYFGVIKDNLDEVMEQLKSTSIAIGSLKEKKK